MTTMKALAGLAGAAVLLGAATTAVEATTASPAVGVKYSNVQAAQDVPEPSSMLGMLAIGGAGVLARKILGPCASV